MESNEITRLSELEWYNSKVRSIIEMMLEEPSQNIYLIGHSEQGFDIDWLEILDEIVFEGYNNEILQKDTYYNGNNNSVVTFLLYKTELGNVLNCSFVSKDEESNVYFADTSTSTKIESYIFNKINPEKKEELQKLTFKVPKEEFKALMKDMEMDEKELEDYLHHEFHELFSDMLRDVY